MKRFLLLLFVALFTVAVLLFIYNPEILEKIWLWIVGLIGIITASVKSIIEWFKKLLDKDENANEGMDNKKESKDTPPSAKGASISNSQFAQVENTLDDNQQNDPFVGTTINLLRYTDDGKSTLSLLFYNNKFFCYALEDTFHPVKIPGETRIPAGTYQLGFNKSVTPLTQKYRDQFQWFNYHLELKSVPNYQAVYLHVGNYHKDTEGCILIADGIGAANSQAMVTHSRQAYQRLYQQVKSELEQGTPARIIVRDESWLTQKLQTAKQTLTPAI